jgi:YidC/Oxa1 family membrane protein insertase
MPPWLWVFNDLSAPDPTSIVNLFGLLPWAAPVAGKPFMALILIGDDAAVVWAPPCGFR